MTAERSQTRPEAHPETLADLRREIDRIDETMHRLLMERGAIIDRLVAVKKTAESGSAFRPGREADMMRRLLARHHGRLPFSAVEHIWRTIIATFTHVQAPYAVHMDGSGDAAPGEVGAMRDVVRFQTGFDVPLEVHADARAVAAAVRASAGDLGFVGLGAVDAPWWDDLGPGEPQIMARLPFLLYEGRPADLPALVIARPLGDASVHEEVVVALERDRRPSGEVLAECVTDGRWRGLVACPPDAVPQGGRVVGGYALPIEPAAVAGTKEAARV